MAINNIPIKHYLAVALTGLILLAGCGKESAPVPEPVQPEKPGTGELPFNHIFKSGEGGYSCFRIPAVIKTNAGTLLAFAEARRVSCGDEGDIDLVVKRSSDKGKTWSAFSIIWSDGENTCGNPAPVVDAKTGKIHLLMTWNLGTDDIGMIGNGTSKDTRRVYKTSSTDDGKSWAAAQEITSTVKQPGWGWYATGPCHGIQITKGAYAGRLVIPCDYIQVGGQKKGFSHVIYSDDNGDSWKLGGVTPVITLNPNESTVAELADGRLMLNMRVSNNNNLRMRSVSNDGGLTWSVPETALTLLDPVCQGSLLSAMVGTQHTLFFSNAASVNRANMTVKMSTNQGDTWSRSVVVYTGPSAYSDLVMVGDNELGLLYEAGTTRPYDGIAWRNIALAEFK
ncbi:exo-alpha-sialidase [Pedobacter yulinensis]|uniref:exo-alpha-sialidase n=1 Tax=Pedobacter yulinensis TaxID=2126353 RepID=A0A2T3HMH7_9SPHI|nr:sialidase family protein [Pedobacter yulinensis]PST83571.1 exo-alpha-sialidase [Pedobacter yulinensis]